MIQKSTRSKGEGESHRSKNGNLELSDTSESLWIALVVCSCRGKSIHEEKLDAAVETGDINVNLSLCGLRRGELTNNRTSLGRVEGGSRRVGGVEAVGNCAKSMSGSKWRQCMRGRFVC